MDHGFKALRRRNLLTFAAAYPSATVCPKHLHLCIVHPLEKEREEGKYKEGQSQRLTKQIQKTPLRWWS